MSNLNIGLGLIVKNEHFEILDCLKTFVPQVDTVVIVDTGSTDDTVEICETFLKQSGKKWMLLKYTECNDEQGRMENFAAARNQYIFALEKLGVDYIITCDADDTYLAPVNLKEYVEKTQYDIYGFKYWIGEDQNFLTYRLWKANKKIHYVGRVHECLNFLWEYKVVNETEIEIKHNPTSHEGQELSGDRNRRILKKEIYPPLRSLFYWANENLDIGNFDEAIKWYLEYIRRFKEGEDVYFDELAHCYFRAARWLQHLAMQRNEPELTAHAEKLSNELLSLDDSWSESWCELAYIARLRGDFESCRKYAQNALKNKFQSRLFSEKDKYSTTPANMIVMCDIHERVKQIQLNTVS